ncbi:uncharacterized protein G2W53_038761 [Senna tora]|uniref:Uncharacterized protein n=1 Tax=Senna tora TaxID=362788 RepID=A0A834W2A2_9FABA|nr:uncharacterized protein G2W53_038761 [Senna tora]
MTTRKGGAWGRRGRRIGGSSGEGAWENG